jgi:hypothetical protein
MREPSAESVGKNSKKMEIRKSREIPGNGKSRNPIHFWNGKSGNPRLASSSSCQEIEIGQDPELANSLLNS